MISMQGKRELTMISLRGSLRPVMMKMLTWAELLMVQHSCFCLCFVLFCVFWYYFYVSSIVKTMNLSFPYL